jgi:hypothetical protein
MDYGNIMFTGSLAKWGDEIGGLVFGSAFDEVRE